MKIIQLAGRIEGSGVTRYIIELNKALKSEGHDVEIVYFVNDQKHENDMQNIPNLVSMKYSQELIDKINSSDILMINSLISVKAKQNHRDDFYKLLRETSGPKKVLFCNDHNIMGMRSYYGLDFLDDPDILMKHIDKFVTFSPHNVVLKKIQKVYPEIINKYVHLQHPYTFTDDIEQVPFEKKYRRITYLGRFANFKDPMRLTRHRQEFIDNEYQVELRGIARTIASACVPGFLYDFNEAGERIGPAAGTLDLTTGKKVIEKMYPGESVDLIHMNDRDLSKVYMFGRYKREDGMKATSYALFGCDFCWNKNPLIYGDNIEYAVAEILDAGSIPMVDYSTMENCMAYKDNKRTDVPLLTMPTGIALKQDGSNIDEVIEEMNKLASDKVAYDNYLKICKAVYKAHFDPHRVAKRLVEDIMNDDNSYALKEFGF